MKLTRIIACIVFFFILVVSNLYSKKITIANEDIIGMWKMIYYDEKLGWGDINLTLYDDVLLIARNDESGEIMLVCPPNEVVFDEMKPVMIKTISVENNIINAVFINLPGQPSGNDIEYTGTMTGNKKTIVLWPSSRQGEINALIADESDDEDMDQPGHKSRLESLMKTEGVIRMQRVGD